MKIRYLVKSAAKRKKIEPKVMELERVPNTLEELIEETVKSVVSDIKNKKDNMDVIKVFTNEQIDEMSSNGKVTFGEIYGNINIDIDKAIIDAKQAFLDGLVAIFIDDMRIEELDEPISIKEDTVIIYVRLCFLNGRMF